MRLEISKLKMRYPFRSIILRHEIRLLIPSPLPQSSNTMASKSLNTPLSPLPSANKRTMGNQIRRLDGGLPVGGSASPAGVFDSVPREFRPERERNPATAILTCALIDGVNP